jgi:hypothetical protein
MMEMEKKGNCKEDAQFAHPSREIRCIDFLFLVSWIRDIIIFTYFVVNCESARKIQK